MIKVQIVKLPPEAYKLARKLEDTLATMVARTVKTMVGVDNNIQNLEITVSENTKGKQTMTSKITRKNLQKLIEEEVRNLLKEETTPFMDSGIRGAIDAAKKSAKSGNHSVAINNIVEVILPTIISYLNYAINKATGAPGGK